jgi:hypothetical protein
VPDHDRQEALRSLAIEDGPSALKGRRVALEPQTANPDQSPGRIHDPRSYDALPPS